MPNRSIKELKAENKELAELNRMFAEAEKQNEEINVEAENRLENVGRGWMASRNGPNWLV